MSNNSYYQQQAARSRHDFKVVKSVKRVEAADLDYQERRQVIALLRIYRQKFPEEYDSVGREVLPEVIS